MSEKPLPNRVNDKLAELIDQMERVQSVAWACRTMGAEPAAAELYDVYSQAQRIMTEGFTLCEELPGFEADD